MPKRLPKKKEMRLVPHANPLLKGFVFNPDLADWETWRIIYPEADEGTMLCREYERQERAFAIASMKKLIEKKTKNKIINKRDNHLTKLLEE